MVTSGPKTTGLKSKVKVSYRKKNSTKYSLHRSTTRFFAGHCLLSGVGSSVSRPLDHNTWFNSFSPSGPTNLLATNSSARSNILGSLVANGWYPKIISPFLISYAASWLSTTRSFLAFAYWNGTAGSILSASYTTDLVKVILSNARRLTPFSSLTTVLISSASCLCKPSPPNPIHLIKIGNWFTNPPCALNPNVNTRLWHASSLFIPNRSASSSSDEPTHHTTL